MTRMISKYIDEYSAQELLIDLLKTDTQNPPGNEKDCVDFILARYKGTKLTVTELSSGENRSSAILKLAGESDCGVAFLGHLDTVPIGNHCDWSYSAIGEIVGDCVYGRGASDMKGGVVSILIMLDYLLDNDIVPPKDIYIILTADEESGSIGITRINESGVFDNIEAIIVGEPTECTIALSEKGAMWVRIHATGKQAHSAKPEEGINAIEMLSMYIDKFKLRYNEGISENTQRETRISTTIFSGGFKNNIIPKSASALVDIRIADRTERERILKSLNRCALAMEEEYGAKIDFDIEADRMPLTTSEQSLLIRELDRVYTKLGLEPEHIGVNYYTDLAGCLHDKQIDFAIIGPGKRTVMHQVDEFVRLSDVKLAAKIYISYIISCK